MGQGEGKHQRCKDITPPQIDLKTVIPIKSQQVSGFKEQGVSSSMWSCGLSTGSISKVKEM